MDIDKYNFNKGKSDRPRLIVIGESGSGKSHFAKRLSEMFDWEHIDIDDKISNGANNIFDLMPVKDFVVANWSIVPGDLPFLAQICVNKEYSIIRFRTSRENIEKTLKNDGFDEDFIFDQERIEEEQYAINLVDILSNIVMVMNTDYFDINGNYQHDDYFKEIQNYYKIRP